MVIVGIDTVVDVVVAIVVDVDVAVVVDVDVAVGVSGGAKQAFNTFFNPYRVGNRCFLVRGYFFISRDKLN